jgi:hypothetical protein
MRSIVGLLVGVLLVAACGPGPTVSPDSPSLTPGTSGVGATPSTDATSPSDPTGFHPLPPDLVLAPGPQDPSASLTSNSAADAQPGVVEVFALEHCGLGSPFDFDGSLWDPVAGRDIDGRPIDSDEEIGELINPTEGEVLLLGSGQAQFRTPAGSIILLTRHVGAKSYFLCM